MKHHKITFDNLLLAASAFGLGYAVASHIAVANLKRELPAFLRMVREEGD